MEPKPQPPIKILSCEVYKQNKVAIYYNIVVEDAKGSRFTVQQASMLYDLKNL